MSAKEIKEILDRMEEAKEINAEQPFLDYHESNLLLDYITNLENDSEMYAQIKDTNEEIIANLQEENERLKEDKTNTLSLYHSEREVKEDYKSRNKKAIKYIKENEFYLDYKTGACVKGVMPLLNILQGSDKE